MFIRDPPKSAARKELKINLPARQHRHLHAMQLRSGQDTTRIIADALDLYLRQMARPPTSALSAPRKDPLVNSS